MDKISVNSALEPLFLSKRRNRIADDISKQFASET